MATGKVIGGQFVTATISINRKGELALTTQGFRRTPNLTADAVSAWEEVFPEKRGAADAIGKVGQAVSRAALPGAAGKAASAAVGSTAELVGASQRTVRVDWTDGNQSLVRLPDSLFQHLEMVLACCRIASTAPPAPAAAPEPPGMIGQLTKLAKTVRATPPDATEQIARLAALRNEGVLSDEEFTAKKAELLRISTSTLALPPPASAGPTSSRPPVPASPAPPPTVPPTWAPDPHGRHELRYWDGTAWTEHVSTGGLQSTDPV
jgi:hypothetical protein